MTGAPATPELLNRYRDGHPSAYGELYERYRPALLSYIRLRLGAAIRRELTPEDVLQETHVEALRSIEGFSYRREMSFFFWLCRIASHRIYYHCRRLERRPPKVERLPRGNADGQTSQDMLKTLAGPGIDPEQTLLVREHLSLLAVALDELPPSWREAVILRCVEGMTPTESAHASGVTANAHSVRLSRGLQRLTAILDRLLGTAGSTERPT